MDLVEFDRVFSAYQKVCVRQYTGWVLVVLCLALAHTLVNIICCFTALQ